MTLHDTLLYYYQSGLLKRRGHPDIQTQDNFIVGQTKPTKLNTGIIFGIPRTVMTQAILTITQDGYILENVELYGIIRIQARNVIIRNVYVHGNNNTTDQTLIDCRSASCINATIERCTLIPDTPSWLINGIMGHDFTATRNLVLNTNDGFGIYRTQTLNVPIKVYLYGNYVDELAFFTGPYGVVHPSDTKTHNDAIQIQGGWGIVAYGNNFRGFLSTDPNVGTNDWMNVGYSPTFGSPWPQSNAAVQVNSTVGNSLYHDFQYNWMDGGGLTVNDAQSGDQGGWYFNRFGRYSRYRFNSNTMPYTLVFTNPVTFSEHDNVFEDDNSPIIVKVL